MLVKIIKVNNPRAKHREGSTRELSFIEDCAILKYIDGSFKKCITSKIKKITIETQNTIYECEVVDKRKED